jgi:endonuclease/exonuclease/phosphatase family metal-dependent hydrolase
MVGQGGQSTIAAVELRVLSWNLFHGRSVPETRGPLFDEFAAALASWDWHVALLQEVPPWWPGRLGTEQRRALTSRNQFLWLTRPLAQWRPGLVKSWGGGSNAILVREQAIREHRVRRLCLRPERRIVHAVRLESGVWVANLHASKRDDDPEGHDVRLAPEVVLAWAGGGPVVLGGDFNVTRPPMDGWIHAARSHVDHVFAHGLQTAGPGTALDHGILSDHRPVLARLSFP